LYGVWGYRDFRNPPQCHYPHNVIPAKAGIQEHRLVRKSQRRWISAFAGMTKRGVPESIARRVKITLFSLRSLRLCANPIFLSRRDAETAERISPSFSASPREPDSVHAEPRRRKREIPASPRSMPTGLRRSRAVAATG